MTELLLDMNLTVEQRECAGQIARSGSRCSRSSTHPRTLGKIETGRLDLDIAAFELPETIRAACSMRAQGALEGPRAARRDRRGGPERVRGDGAGCTRSCSTSSPTRSKFTPAGSVVGARRGERSPRAREVIDTGSGSTGEPRADVRAVVQADVSTTGLRRKRPGARDRPRPVELMGARSAAHSEPGTAARSASR